MCTLCVAEITETKWLSLFHENDPTHRHLLGFNMPSVATHLTEKHIRLLTADTDTISDKILLKYYLRVRCLYGDGDGDGGGGDI